MQYQQWRRKIRVDLAEAALDSGFALLDLASRKRAEGSYGDANQAVEEARAALAEGRRRAPGLKGADANRVEGRARELRAALDTAPEEWPAARRAKVIEMPRRRELPQRRPRAG